jgi:hypothetical protein
MSTSVALGRHFEEFVRKQIFSGRFNNVSCFALAYGYSRIKKSSTR